MMLRIGSRSDATRSPQRMRAIIAGALRLIDYADLELEAAINLGGMGTGSR